MVNLRSGKKVPFLGKNIPKRSYSYKKPISREEECELVSKIGSISIHEVHYPNIIPETVQSKTLAQDNDTNELTYGSMPSLEGSQFVENYNTFDDGTVESVVQSESQSESEDESEIDINAAGLPDNLNDIVENFEKEMVKLDDNFDLMGLLKATTKVINKPSPSFHDSSDSSQDSFSSVSSHDMTEDSLLISDDSTITGKMHINKRKKAVFFDSSASSLSSTLNTMIEKTLDSDLSTDEDGCCDVEQSHVTDERKPKFSENSYQEICEMYTEFCQ